MVESPRVPLVFDRAPATPVCEDHRVLPCPYLRRVGAGDLGYARKLVARVQGGESSAQTPIQQQAFTLRGWIDASIQQPRNKEDIALLKESVR